MRVAVNATQQRAQELTNIAKAFGEKNPGVTVEFTPIQAPDHDQFFVKLLTEMAGGKQTDLVNVATEGLQLFAGKDLAVKLDELVQADKGAMQEYFSDVSPALVEAMMYEGSLYELPANFNAANMFLNLDASREGRHPAADRRLDPRRVPRDRPQAGREEGRHRPAGDVRLRLDEPALGRLRALDLRERLQPADRGAGARAASGSGTRSTRTTRPRRGVAAAGAGTRRRRTTRRTSRRCSSWST